MGEFVIRYRICPRCRRVHEGDGECSAWMAAGRFCCCKLQVPRRTNSMAKARTANPDFVLYPDDIHKLARGAVSRSKFQQRRSLSARPSADWPVMVRAL